MTLSRRRSPYASELTYLHALEVLGARDSRALELARRLAGVPAGAATVASGGQVDLLNLRDELAGWGQAAVGRVKSWIGGVDRFSRGQLLCAAHAVLVVTAFFEGLDEAARAAGVDLGPARISRAEQAALATGEALPDSWRQMIEMLVTSQLPMPSPDAPHEQILDELGELYARVVKRLASFLDGLAAVEGGSRVEALEPAVVDAGVLRYQDLFRRLCIDVPEFDVWVSMHDSRATRSAIERIPDALREAGRQDVAELAALLIRSYQARLERPVVEDGATPEGMRAPSLGELFVSPRCRSSIVDFGDPGAEAWWHRANAWPDAYAHVTAQLMQPRAARHPIVILGQPGSGKTSLMRMLAAGLPQLGFVAVLGELRTVPASAPLQVQVEHALREQAGRTVEWPELAEASRAALPVLLLDGLDELLQASSSDHADYLERVVEFQRHQAELGRPVAAIVTARTVVGARVRFPAGAAALRLEPFDDANIGDWLDRWNRQAAPVLRGAGREPLTAEQVMAHGDLAREPLLLLMLALYHSGTHPLSLDDTNRARLYGQILTEFVRREVRKGGGFAAREAQEIERELRRLSAVAAAMFVRGRQSIRDAELERDLQALLGEEADDARRTLGRFFFVYESIARKRPDEIEQTFEFLHATFGEFLFSRLIVETLGELAEEQEYRSTRPRSAALDAGRLHALLSFAPITARAPTVSFCGELLADLPADQRAAIHGLTTVLLKESMDAHPTWSLATYEPVKHGVPARHAAFSASLVVLAVLSAKAPRFGEDGVLVQDLVGADKTWRSLSLLWKSQLGDDGWRSLRDTLRAEYLCGATLDDSGENEIPYGERRVKLESGQDVSLWRSALALDYFYAEPGSALFQQTVYPDVSVPRDDPFGVALRNIAFAGYGEGLHELAQAIAPLYEVGIGLGPGLVSDNVIAPLARALLWLRLSPVTEDTAERRLATYLLLVRIAVKVDAQAPWLPIVWRQLIEDAPTLPRPHLALVVLEAIEGGVVDADACRKALGALADAHVMTVAERQLHFVLGREEEMGMFEPGEVDRLRAMLDELLES